MIRPLMPLALFTLMLQMPLGAQSDAAPGVASAEAVAENVAENTELAPGLREAIEHAVREVKPALVRIHVVETYYREGREMKYESSGSGVVISPEGHVITNHHVAGHAKQLEVTFANKEEYEAELIGGDPLTDIAVIKITPDEDLTFPTVSFADSSEVQVGDHVLSMGSPYSLSQSVTLGVISNTEMVMPEWMGSSVEQDGEDVGALVRWIAHDAEIHPGNSGGPLVNLDGKIIGINEIGMGLGGAIPGNLAKDVAEALIADGEVERAWLGVEIQPRLKHSDAEQGVLVAGTLEDSPAEEAGFESGDLLVAVNGQPVDVRFREQLPDFNLLASELPIGETATFEVLRDGERVTLEATPTKREPRQPDQYEMRDWGITVRNISNLMAKELKRDSTDGVLVTSVRPGGPSGSAKPTIENRDIITAVDGKPVTDVESLKEITAGIVEGAEEPVPALTNLERKARDFVTVVKVGVSEIRDPSQQVRKAWIPVETQVITSDIAEALGDPELTGFRVAEVYKGSEAETAGLQVGDLILSVDGEKLTASAPEHYEELPALIRQYRIGDTAELTIKRGDERQQLSVELAQRPPEAREMKKYQDENFEFTVRDITFHDKASEQWEEARQGVLVDQVKPGSWAALGQLDSGDLIEEVNGEPIGSVEEMQAKMEQIAEEKPEAVVFRVLRGIHTVFRELEPKWEEG